MITQEGETYRVSTAVESDGKMVAHIHITRRGFVVKENNASEVWKWQIASAPGTTPASSNPKCIYFKRHDEAMDALKELNRLTGATTLPGKVTSMFKSVSEDAVAFVKEHKDTIYIVGAIALLDQLLFGGAFRTRIKALVENLLSKVEAKLKGADAASTTETK